MVIYFEGYRIIRKDRTDNFKQKYGKANGGGIAILYKSDIKVQMKPVADKDDELVGWLRQMSNERFRHVPVVEKSGKLINIMSQGDFVSYTWPNLLYQVKELAKEGYPKVNQLVMIVVGILIYTLITTGMMIYGIKFL